VLTGPRELVQANESRSLVGYRWQRSGRAFGSPGQGDGISCAVPRPRRKAHSVLSKPRQRATSCSSRTEKAERVLRLTVLSTAAKTWVFQPGTVSAQLGSGRVEQMSQDAENVRGGLGVGHLGEGLGHLVKGCGEFTVSLRVAPELYERGNQIIGCHSGVAVRLQPRC
jgi:hypothetical protein